MMARKRWKKQKKQLPIDHHWTAAPGNNRGRLNLDGSHRVPGFSLNQRPSTPLAGRQRLPHAARAG